MNIGIDIDDTISETFEALIPYAQKYLIEDLYRSSEIDYFVKCESHFYIEKMSHWTDEESEKFWAKYYDEIIESVNIKKFASEAINKLKKDGHKIFLITARWDRKNQNTEQITKDWLKRYNIVYDKLIINVKDKLEIAKQMDIDLFIDDTFENCTNILNNSNIKVLMMNTNVNEKLDIGNIKRVFSWPEIYYLISNNNI